MLTPNHRFITVRVLLFLALLMQLAGLPATSVQAAPTATFVVTSLLDQVDAAPGDGVCAIAVTLGGGCTLRAAVEEANLRPGADTIEVGQGNYFLNIAGINNGVVTEDDLDITDPAGLTLIGLGAQMIPTGHGAFHIHAGAQAMIEGVTVIGLRNGYFNEGHLTLNNTTINGSFANVPLPTVIQASSASSQAALVIGLHNRGVLTATNLLITNFSPQNGVAIQIDGDAGTIRSSKLRNLTVSNNATTGLLTGGSNHQIEILDSTFDHNTRALELNGGTNQVTIRNSTLSNQINGGILVGAGTAEFALSVGIFNSTLSGNQGDSALRLTSNNQLAVQVTLNNVTITNNHGNGAVGGVFAPNTSNANAALSIKNSIIAGNTTFIPLSASQVNESQSNPSDCSGAFSSQGHNLIGSIDGCTIKGDTASNIIGQNPALGPLRDNGGATLTHAPQSGSPALNAGNPAQPGSGGKACEASDQNETNRPQGVACDIGAVEVAGLTANPPILSTLTPTNTVAGSTLLLLNLDGMNFTANSRVRWRGLTLTPNAFGPTTLRIAISAPELTTGKVITVAVFDQTTGFISTPLPFTISNPQPSVSSASPTQVLPNSSALVTLKGSNFVPTSQVLLDGRFMLQTTFVNGQEVKAMLPASATTPLGKAIRLTVRNPLPGGGTSVNGVTVRVGQLTTGVGAFSSSPARTGDPATLTLAWEHPVDWRLLADLDLRLLDEAGKVMLWLGFAEAFGDKGAIVLRNHEGAITSLGFPGETPRLATDIGLVELSASQIDAQPGKTVTVHYAFRFDPALQGRTFQVEFSANDKEGNSQGFEAAGTLTVSSTVFLPLVTR